MNDEHDRNERESNESDFDEALAFEADTPSPDATSADPWQPKRGKLTRAVAWVILIAIGAMLIAMIAAIIVTLVQ